MKWITCDECGQRAPMRECYRVEERDLCVDCTRAAIERRRGGPTPEGSVVQLSDPSICARCRTDLDGQEARPLGEAFVCAPCDQVLRNRPFPTWLKGAAALILGMVVVSFVHNGRFIQARIEMARVKRAYAAQDIESAAKYATAAARHVPESDELKQVARQLAGIDALRRAASLLGEEGKENTVVELVTAALPDLPEAYRKDAQVVKLSAEQSLAFDHKDYDTFLAKADEMAKVAPDNPMSLHARTSALAAKYAATGDESFKTQAIESLEKCKKLETSKRPDFAEFLARVEHRLATREILSRKEFTGRFPQGWKPSEKEVGQK